MLAEANRLRGAGRIAGQNPRALGKPRHLRAMPLKGLEALRKSLEQRIDLTLRRQVDAREANFGPPHQADFAAERGGQQLMAKANPEIGPAEIAHPVPDSGLFADEPRIGFLLPDIHAGRP